MKSPLRIALMICAFCLLAGACTSGGTATSDERPDGAEAGKSATATSQEPIAKEFSKVNVPAPAVNERTPECVTVQPKPLSSPIPEDDSFIHITIAPVYDMGPDCNRMSPGGSCQVPLRGAWRVHGCPTQSCGSVVIQVFENDDKEPVRSPEVGPVPAAGQFNPDTSRLTYKVGEKAKSATLRAVLKDITGRVVARSEPHTVPIPLCVVEEGSG